MSIKWFMLVVTMCWIAAMEALYMRDIGYWGGHKMPADLAFQNAVFSASVPYGALMIVLLIIHFAVQQPVRRR